LASKSRTDRALDPCRQRETQTETSEALGLRHEGSDPRILLVNKKEIIPEPETQQREDPSQDHDEQATPVR
jgi:hypothetical protein